MFKSEMRTDEFNRFLSVLAGKSGDIIKQYFWLDNKYVELKSDQTPVTRADRDAEAVMREQIRKTYPEHGIIGEEFGEENSSAEFVWTLDPIDGTVSFSSGCPLFGTLISLLHQNKPILGAIHIPLLALLCIGDGRQTSVNGRVVKLRDVTRLSDAFLLTTDLTNIRRTKHRDGFNLLLDQTQLFRTWGDCYGYLMVVSGKADIMLDLNMKIWDIMPLIPIVRGANGIITTWSEDDVLQKGSCLATNPALHPQVLKILSTQSAPK
jgi:myo-inositol-1(or 4)-monophosphatase